MKNQYIKNKADSTSQGNSRNSSLKTDTYMFKDNTSTGSRIPSSIDNVRYSNGLLCRSEKI